MFGSYPAIDLKNLTTEEKNLAKGIINSRTGLLRASSPDKDLNQGQTQYIWRMVAFYASPNYQHHSIPMSTDLYLETPEWDTLQAFSDKWYADNRNYKGMHDSTQYKELSDAWHGAKKQMIKKLDAIVDKILATIPTRKQHGLNRWQHAIYG